jgi:hypothetical protein
LNAWELFKYIWLKRELILISFKEPTIVGSFYV